jgi:hypothetical protein
LSYMTEFFGYSSHDCHCLDKNKSKLTCLNKNNGIV